MLVPDISCQQDQTSRHRFRLAHGSIQDSANCKPVHSLMHIPLMIDDSLYQKRREGKGETNC